MMKTIKILIIFLTLYLFSGQIGSAQQPVNAGQDTIRTQTAGSESAISEGEQVQNRNGNMQSGNEAKPDNARAVKRIRGGRPDMSKAKGARPPSIVRPSGSGIPKGIGKPGGAGNRGGR